MIDVKRLRELLEHVIAGLPLYAAEVAPEHHEVRDFKTTWEDEYLALSASQPVSQLIADTINALPALLDVYEAACERRDARCSRLVGCASYTEEHDDECAIETTQRALDATVAATRGGS